MRRWILVVRLLNLFRWLAASVLAFFGLALLVSAVLRITIPFILVIPKNGIQDWHVFSMRIRDGRVQVRFRDWTLNQGLDRQTGMVPRHTDEEFDRTMMGFRHTLVYRNIAEPATAGGWEWYNNVRDETLSGPSWVFSLILLCYPLVEAKMLVRRARRGRRIARGQCESCGYDLRGSPRGVCSECGRPSDHSP